MTTLDQSMAALCARHAPNEGINLTALAPLKIFKRSAPSANGNVIYTRSLFIVAQGRKRASLGDDVFVYDQDRYLVTSVPLPVVAQVLDASEARPFLSVGLDLDIGMLRDVLTRGRAVFETMPPAKPQRGLAASKADPALKRATVRLLELLDTPDDLPVLADLLIQEIAYLVLKGPQGSFLRATALGHGQQHAIAQILLAIHSDCARDFSIPELASEAGLSESVFYESFKTVTATSPIQYIKRLRLMEAHRQLTHGLANVSEAAYSVGYNSTSQFSREFKRVFGAAPSSLRSA